MQVHHIWSLFKSIQRICFHALKENLFGGVTEISSKCRF